ncbi:MAG: hypothetical protein WDM81_11865 [Rhizomicrobium sp.]
MNALPTTPALGAADIDPGFGSVCFFDDCIDIVTGVETIQSPPPGPNPPGTVSTGSAGPFGALGIDGWRALVQSFIAFNRGQDCGAAIVSVASLSNSSLSATGQACVSGQANPGGPGGATSDQTDWLNPEGTATVAGVDVQGAPGASPARS